MEFGRCDRRRCGTSDATYNRGRMTIAPGSRIGPYEVTAHLGEGGMGVVFRGRDSRFLALTGRQDARLASAPVGAGLLDGGPVFLDLTGPSGTRDFVSALFEE